MTPRIHHESRCGALHDYFLTRWVSSEDDALKRFWLGRAIGARLSGTVDETRVAAVERIASAVATRPQGLEFIKRFAE